MMRRSMRWTLPGERPSDAALLPQGEQDGPMPWIIAIMTCLAMLGLAAALALSPAASALSGQIVGRATIQIVESDTNLRREAVRTLRETLTTAPFVRAVRVVPEQELQAMAARWLGNGLGGTGISLPALIDVDLVRGDDATLARLRSVVGSTVAGARVIPHAEWLGPVAGLMRGLGWLAAGIALLLIMVMAAVVMLASRAGLKAQSATIDILHLVGATDVQIARLFQRQAARMALKGALLGLVAAIILIVLLGWRLSGIESGLGSDTGWWPYGVPLVVPPLVLAVSMLSARYAVLAQLRRTP